MKHKHHWKLTHTEWQYLQPYGMSSTAAQQEVAYLMCEGCLTVKKQIIEQPKEGKSNA